jgi:hypothetical protein
MSSPVWFSIPEFTGIQQHKDGRLLPISSAYDARNIDTSDGNLNVAKGFSKLLANNTAYEVPGSSVIKKLIMVPGLPSPYNFYVVTETTIYRHKTDTGAWSVAYDDDTSADFAFGYSVNGESVNTLTARIGNDDVILVCTTRNPIVVIKLSNGHVRSFGSGLLYKPAYSSNNYVSYNSSTRTLTMDTYWSTEYKTRALAFGIYYGPDTSHLTYAEVESVPSSTTLILKNQPSAAFASGDYIWPAGGSSNVSVRTAVMFAGRLFATEGTLHPVRLNWSAVPGDGRTIEDWTMVDGSEDASGGYVEVGDNTYDSIVGLTALSNQLIIWKKYSVWRLLGDRPSTFTLELVEKNTFGINPASYQIRPIVFHDAPYFMLEDGLYTYDTVGIVPVDNGGSHIKGFLAGFTDENLRWSRSTLHKRRFYISCRVGNHNSNYYDNALVVFDTVTGTYMIRDGFEIADIVSDGQYIFLINGDRYIYKFEDGNTYNGTKIHAYWQTQPIDFGRKMYRHQLMGMYMQLTGGDVKINITGDYAGSSKELVAKKDTTRKGYIAVRVQTDQSNEFSFTFDNKTGNSTYTNFAIKGGINIKALDELKE